MTRLSPFSPLALAGLSGDGQTRTHSSALTRLPPAGFRIAGPSVSRMLTGEDFTGTKAAVLTLRKGTYRFLCAPHAEDMRGSFKVS